MWGNTFVLLFDYLVSTRAGNVIAVFLGALIFYFIFRLIVRIIDYIMFKRLVDSVLDTIYYNYYDEQASYDKDDERSHKKDKECGKIHKFDRAENMEKDIKYSGVDEHCDQIKSKNKDSEKLHAENAGYNRIHESNKAESSEKDVKYSSKDDCYEQVKFDNEEYKKKSYTDDVDRDYTNKTDHEDDEEENNIKHKKTTKNNKKRKIVGVAEPVGKWTLDMMRQWMKKHRNIDMNLMNNSGYFQALVDKQKKTQDGTGINR